MARVYKHYRLNLNDAATVGGHVAFSSYGGMLVSTDDFYLLGSGLAMVQTRCRRSTPPRPRGRARSMCDRRGRTSDGAAPIFPFPSEHWSGIGCVKLQAYPYWS